MYRNMSKKLNLLTWVIIITCTFFGSLLHTAKAQVKIDPKLLNMKDGETRSIFVRMKEQADLEKVKSIKGKEAKTSYVYEKLWDKSLKSQEKIKYFLDSVNTKYRSYYIVNGISLQGNKSMIETLAQWSEIDMIVEDSWFMMAEIQRDKDESRTVEWGVSKIKAPQVWAQGFKGQNVVIGGQDTGYQWDHSQLRNKYRGWNGTSATHDYHWHDAVHQNHPMNSGNNPCGYNLSAPCDDHNHGTHTMGTMVGHNNADTIGVAPQAKWIGCRNMERGYGSLTTYVECFEWFLAPYAYGDGPENGDPAKMPHVINNSWGCPTIEGCNTTNFAIMEEALMNLRNAGCVIVVSNGNSGGTCSTTFDPPAFFEGSFSVGATNSTNAIASFSSRGPVTWDGSNRLKPNVVAPGVSVRSSVRNNGYATYNGTSMAGPHVAGAVALIISANPGLAGEVDQIEDILEQTTLPLYGGSTCGSILPTATPNNTFGYGLIDVEKAVARARDSLFVPIVKVDQFGYRTTDKKVAVFSDPIIGYNENDQYMPGPTVALKNAITHQVVYSASPTSWNNGATHGQSGDRVWWFDFSSFTQPGTYYVADGAVRSEDFNISDTVFHQVFKTAFKTFYHQRCGTPKSGSFVLPGYVDDACHLQDISCKFYSNPTRTKDLSGGWHDAGDYNKYVNFAYTAVFDLLFSYHLHPEAWVSDAFGIPESGNSIPDMLDEIKYETDWLLKMQEQDGGVLSMVGVANHATSSPPSADSSDRLYGPASTSASCSASAILAFTALQFKKIDNSTALQYAITLENAAVNAYNWAVNNPDVRFYNQGIIGAGEQEIDSYETSMRIICAAVFLYELTGQSSYKNHVENHYAESHMKQWNFVYPFENPTLLSLLYFAHLSGVTPAVTEDIKNTFASSLENSADNLPAHVNGLDAYRAFINSNNYTWGSNRTKSNMGNLYTAYQEYGLNTSNNPYVEEITSDYLGYFHGKNPVGRSFLTNMRHLGADMSINSIYHNWFSDGSPLWDDVRKSTYGPAPGFLSGGVNPSYALDGCCINNTCGFLNYLCNNLQPPLQQPVQKSYLDWNTGWPQNSWQITEPAIYYQSAYLFQMAGKVNYTHQTPQALLPVKQIVGDIYIETQAKGIIFRALNGDNYRITVSNTGHIISSGETNPVTTSTEFVSGNLIISENQKGFLLHSQDNQLWRISVNSSGRIVTENLAGLPPIHTKITGADVYFSQPGQGVVLKDFDGLCYRIHVNSAGLLFSSVISCD
jgi:subtilisin family serine protease